MREYTIITAPQDLLPQVVGELLAFATNPDLVDVVHGSRGREIHAHPEVAEAWYQARQQVPEPGEEVAPEPVQPPAPAPEPEQSVPSPVQEPVLDTPQPAPQPVPQSAPQTASRKK